MIQLRSGDLVAVQRDGLNFRCAILTKQILFGGHWTFVFHGAQPTVLHGQGGLTVSGFNAFVDFIIPKREGRVVRVCRNSDFSSLKGPELLQQPPILNSRNYQLYRWRDGDRESVERVGFTSSPTAEQSAAPYYSCIPASLACDLAARHWKEHQPMWNNEI